MALRIADVPVSRWTRIVRPCAARASAKLMANVVLPTPPLPDEIGMIRFTGVEGLRVYSRAHVESSTMHPAFFRKFVLFAELDDRELASIATVASTRPYPNPDATFHSTESA